MMTGRDYLNRALECHGRDDYPSLFPHLEKSIRCLLPTQEYELIARAYNLFAIHAQRTDCYDIAYHYFMMADSFASKIPGSYSGALIEANVGDLLADLGEYRKAGKYISHAVSAIRRHKEEDTSTRNAIMVAINLGICRLSAGDIPGARKMIPVIERGLKKTGGEEEHVACWYLFMQVHLFLMTGETRNMLTCLDEMISRVIRTPDCILFAENICNLLRVFLQHDAVREAGMVLSALEENKAVVFSTAVRFKLADIRIAYYTATGQHERKYECYEERNRLSALYRAEQMRFYRDSVALMKLEQELRTQQESARAENKKLQHKAETDALTRIPNRHALNSAMEEAYDRAVLAQVPFGLGVVDVDYFKQYNDRYGHRTGDQCLVSVAEALSEIAKEHGLFVARYGGDEFVLLYENMTDDAILRVEEQIHRKCPVSVSHGFYVTVPSAAVRLWDFFSRADERLYRIKTARR